MVGLSLVAGTILFSGCSSDGSNNSSNPANEAKGTTVVKKSALPMGDASCPTGGAEIQIGFDTNNDGVIDQITQTEYVCNGESGSDGSDGQNSLISVTEISAGATCTYGGMLVLSGLDTNSNDTLETTEVLAQENFCFTSPSGEAVEVSLIGSRTADFGKDKEDYLLLNSEKYFGFGGALKDGYDAHVARADVSDAKDAILLADGLTASFLTRDAANHSDLFNFWPHGSTTPTHIFSCIEGGEETLENGMKNPSVQSWNLETGEVTTVLRGMERCDGLRTTPWGTLVATEETTDGGVYEIIDPLNVVDHTIEDRTAGTIVDDTNVTSTKVVKRTAMATMAWEGLTVLDSGIIIGGDELRPGTTAQDADGGAIFKFVPTTPRTTTGNIAELSESPLVAGSNYAMAVSCSSSKVQLGQGCEIGNATWIEVDAATARESADANGATGYYRPEDLHKDPTYEGEGVRFCWTATGSESSEQYGEIICAVDSDPLNVGQDALTTIVNRFVEGDTEFTSVDSLDIHPITGDIYGIEDHKNGDVWACLKDGADRDIKTDGCVRLLAVKDQSAEPTGFIFSPDGTKAYLSIQHSNDDGFELVDGYRTDDIIVIEGFKAVDSTLDYGKEKENELHVKSKEYYGFEGALKDGYDAHVARADVSDAKDAILLADGLTASFLTRDAANHADLFNFWPHGSTTPTHIFSCIEGGEETLENGMKNPSVQSWNLETGEVTTVLRGMERCDGLRTTPWGTLVATEETTDGGVYEIIDPLNVVDHTIEDRTAGTIVDDTNVTSTKVVKRTAMATMAWEGLTVLDSGIIIGGDELRPGTTAQDADGGAIFKFVPTTPRTTTGNIAELSESPLVAGSNYAMAVSCSSSKVQLGQGCEIGNATWIEVDAATARESADANGATGYYRPEDLHKDPTYEGEGVRFCWTATGSESSEQYGEIICAVDSDPLNVGQDALTTIVNRFVEGDTEFTSVDSLDIHPITGDIYGIEDHKNGDVWACLKDGADRDIKTDGCVRLLAVKDQSAEPTGFIFSPDGTKAYLSIQHSNDDGFELVDGYRTDDIIVIEGFGFPNK
jgi:secreted PhoX family phosphatase